MTSKSFQAVIFDLDGVLTDTAHFHFVAWQELAASLGIALDHSFNEQLKGVDRMGSLELILAASTHQYSQQQKLEMANRKNQRYLELIADMSPADLLPGAKESLQSLRMQALLVGLASASKNALAVLKSLGIQDCFDTVVDAAKIANGKPDPEIFLTAARQLHVPPESCLGVEDSIAGIKSIKSAGMTALGIGKAQVLTEADYVIADLSAFALQRYAG